MANEITLTLEPFGAAATAVAEQTTAEEKTAALEEMTGSVLSEEEKQQIEAFSKTIDVTKTADILSFGAGTQQKIADFSDSALAAVRTQDLGTVGEDVAKLVGELKSFSGDIEKTNKGLFRGTKRKIATLKSKYDDVNKSVNDIVTVLDGHQVTLLKDIAVLDKLYDTNLTYFKELSMYILAGKKALEEQRSTTLVELTEKAKASGLPEDAQKASDYAQMCDRLEKKVYDLELSRMVSIQMAPQIRLIQNNDTMMSERIQSTVVNTIPLWKGQMVLALGLAHTEEALKAEKAVTDMTNELLKKNAEKLHQSTVAVARENERGIIDIETLTATNQELINTLDEVRQIRTEGHQKRVAAEAELARIENELKNKLLELDNKKVQ